MSISAIRATLERLQASLRVAEGKLGLRGPGSALRDRELIEMIKQHREEIIARIEAGEAFEYERTETQEIPPNLLVPGADRITPELLPLVTLSQEEIDQIVASVPNGARGIQDIYPLTPLQEGMLFHHLMAEKGDPYLIWSIYSFADQEIFDVYIKTYDQVIARHDILRTVLRWEALREPVQVVLREAHIHVEYVDLDAAGADVVAQLKARFDPTFYRLDLRDAPLIKLMVARDMSGRLVVMELSHHLTTDRTTGDIITSELMAIMAGQGEHLPQPIPYRNFVAKLRSGLDRNEHDAFFRDLLQDVDRTTAPFGLLDVHRDGSEIIESSTVIDGELGQSISNIARAKGLSATAMIHVAWGHVLARLCNTDLPVFGTVMFGRLKTGGGNERILGVSINTLPVLVRAERPVTTCVRDMQTLLADLLHHEHAPLTATQKAANLPNGIPLFTSVINYRHSSAKDRSVSSAVVPDIAVDKVEFIAQHEGNNYPLTLSVDDYGTSFKFMIQAATGIDPELILSLVRVSLANIVDALSAASPVSLNALSVLTREQEQALILGCRGETVPIPENRCIHHFFEEQAAASPDRLAIRSGDQRMTYGQLASRANGIVGRLQQAGVGKGAVVGTCLRRSIDQVATMIAIFKAGATYLPLDPDYPQERLDYLMLDSACRVVVTLDCHAERVAGDGRTLIALDDWPDAAVAAVPVDVSSEDVAYLLYTSGSTGRPKGVIGLHRALTSRLLPERRLRDGSEVYGQKTSINFIDSFWEVFMPLTTGGVIEILPHDTVQDPDAFCRVLGESRISHLVLVPTLLAAMVSHLQASRTALPDLKYCVSSGEPLSLELANRFVATLPHVDLINIYGTTEFWDATAHRVSPFEARTGVALGMPMPNVGLYLLDERLRPVPHGVEADLYVTSLGIGPGYYGRPDLSHASFLPCPFEPGRVMYRTGDRVRWREGSGLEYLGRADRQINLHGYRIEPGEIEHALIEHASVTDAVVVARRQDEDTHLAAYVVPATDVRQESGHVPFGLFYFSDSGATSTSDEIALYIETVRRADTLGFNAVWTPERHFTEVGAVFPNPSVLSAAAAMVTSRVRLRSGSVVLPLHDPLRVAEEWAVVDRLSHGRVELSFASGWVPNDFVLKPENFADRHAVMLKSIADVQNLWRGGPISRTNGVGAEVDVRSHPRPIQAELPTWITAAGALKTFEDAGRLGANVLTHVLNTTTVGLSEKIAAYRKARRDAGFDPATGKVAVMVHAYVHENADTAMTEARPHLERYFTSQLRLRKEVGAAVGLEVLADEELSEELIGLAVERFLATKALVGSPESCVPIVHELYDAGADEIACLIDFGLPGERILAGLDSLDRLSRMSVRGLRPQELATHLKVRLPSYMLPDSITVLERLPLTPNGKLDRLALPDPETQRATRAFAAPRNDVEAELARIWAEVLRLEKVGIDDRFFDLGGNSVAAIRMINRAKKALGLNLSIRNLFEQQTIEALMSLQAAEIPSVAALSASQSKRSTSAMMKLSPGSAAPPLFCIHGGTGDASFYAKLASRLGSAASVHAIQYPALAGQDIACESIEQLATIYIGLIKQHQPTGPYRLLGWSFGGLAVYEMARQLRRAGEEVSHLVMLDALIASGEPPVQKWNELEALYYLLKVNDLLQYVEDIGDLERADTASLDVDTLLDRALELLKSRQLVTTDGFGRDEMLRSLWAVRDVIYMSLRYRPLGLEGDALYVAARDDAHDMPGMVGQWKGLVAGDLELVTVDMRHNRMFDDMHMSEIAAIVRDALMAADVHAGAE
ncbi:non-ribosomal peptide synthetase [Xanthomonas sp. D-109]|uniref:non-ribosomal peptide synthetase n=1 Tax=Xanthomonas sp. D-109 TaxID=2821274 RepID=UPI001ADB2B57|nr:non-ribosomal peptide synthetase [Xanthomonas sp. D-109]MBO9883270.1 amino acid adenylation domain-containing protein [Xanthomonas sp. D-109]